LLHGYCSWSPFRDLEQSGAEDKAFSAALQNLFLGPQDRGIVRGNCKSPTNINF